MSQEEALHKFGFLLGAFEFGAPPHGGIAFGFDRLCSILGGSESIRDFIAFPKNNSGRDVMLDAPSSIDDKQLDELQIQLNQGQGLSFIHYSTNYTHRESTDFIPHSQLYFTTHRRFLWPDVNHLFAHSHSQSCIVADCVPVLLHGRLCFHQF